MLTGPSSGWTQHYQRRVRHHLKRASPCGTITVWWYLCRWRDSCCYGCCCCCCRLDGNTMRTPDQEKSKYESTVDNPVSNSNSSSSNVNLQEKCHDNGARGGNCRPSDPLRDLGLLGSHGSPDIGNTKLVCRLMD
ncbi:uncharacterized protein [Physcomitrium patens]|uniref:uncharacterized protein isoform X2 n=1 Tax=Physcomitrium patens TaxID=3218 RepID=UPI003CCE00CC